MVQYSLLLMSTCMSAEVSPYVCADYFIYVLPFWKELHTRLTVCSVCIISPFVINLFPDRNLVTIVIVPGHSLLFTFCHKSDSTYLLGGLL